MKFKNKILLCLFFVLLFICLPQSVEAKEFRDVRSSDWFYSEVQTASQNGWVTGYDDGSFRPNANVTHAEALVMVMRMDGLSFNTNGRNWYDDAFKNAKADNYFPYFYEENYNNANSSITRGDVIRLIYFATGLNKSSGSMGERFRFEDVDGSDEWVYVPINTLAYLGAIEGELVDTGNELYAYAYPNKYLTRAELCAMLSRVSNLNVDLIISNSKGDIRDIQPGKASETYYKKNDKKEDIDFEIDDSGSLGSKSNPFDFLEDNSVLFFNMRESILSGNPELYVLIDYSKYERDFIKDRGSELLSVYKDAIQSVSPMYNPYKQIKISQEYIGNNTYLGKFEITFNEGSIKSLFEEYERLVDYVQSDIEKLYDEGILDNSMSDKEKAIAVAEYIALNTTYNYNNQEKAHRGIGFYENCDLVCDGYSGLFNVFMQELGIESYVIIGKTESGHAWNLSKLDGEWLLSDVTYSDPVATLNGVLFDDFDSRYIGVTSSKIRDLDIETNNGDRVSTVTYLKYFDLDDYDD